MNVFQSSVSRLAAMLLIAAPMMAATNGATTDPASPDPVAALSGSRVLLVFAPSTDAPQLRQQISLLDSHNFDLAEDNLVVVPVASGDAQGAFSGENLVPASTDQQAADRQRFHVADGQFQVVLLSADGQELQRWNAPVTAEQINDKLPTATSTPAKKHKRWLVI